MLHNSIEFSYFSIQLYEYLIQNHPHRAHDYDFIKMRGDAAAEEFESSLRDDYMQDEALAFVMDNLYRGLHFSLHNLIKDVLWSEFADNVHGGSVDLIAQKLYPELKHLYAGIEPDETNYSRYKEVELNDVDEAQLRESLVVEIRRILTENYGI